LKQILTLLLPAPYRHTIKMPIYGAALTKQLLIEQIKKFGAHYRFGAARSRLFRKDEENREDHVRTLYIVSKLPPPPAWMIKEWEEAAEAEMRELAARVMTIKEARQVLLPIIYSAYAPQHARDIKAGIVAFNRKFTDMKVEPGWEKFTMPSHLEPCFRPDRNAWGTKKERTAHQRRRVVREFFQAMKSGWSSDELRHEPKKGERGGGKRIFKKGHQFRKRYLHKYDDELGYGQEEQDFAHKYGMTKTGKLPKTKLETIWHIFECWRKCTRDAWFYIDNPHSECTLDKLPSKDMIIERWATHHKKKKMDGSGEILMDWDCVQHCWKN